MSIYTFVSSDAYDTLKEQLEQRAILIQLEKNHKCYDAVAKHPDIQFLVVGEDLFVDQSVETDRGRWLIRSNPRYIHILPSDLGDRYPQSVPFNGKIYDRTFIHNLKNTDAHILEFLKKNSYDLIHVNQGYTGCSLLLLKDKKGITSDKGIHDVLIEHDFDILLIQEGHIHLEGLNHGFIGGCCGVFEDKVFVNGDLNSHVDGEKIRSFIEESGYEIVEVKGEPLSDIGSVLFWEGKDA